MDDDIDQENCVELSYGTEMLVEVNNDDKQHVEGTMCLKMPEPSGEKQVILIRVDSQLLMVRKSPFPTGDDEECEDDECLEVRSIGPPSWLLDRVFSIRNIHGEERIFIKLRGSAHDQIFGKHPQEYVLSISVLSAIDDAGIDKMGEFGRQEQCVLLRDIAGTLPNTAFKQLPQDGASVIAVNITKWLSKSFGRSSDKFMMRQMEKESHAPPLFDQCWFRGTDVDKCTISPIYEEVVDQVICVSKVFEDILGQSVAADPVANNNLLDAIVQNHSVGNVLCLCVAFVCVLSIFKVLKKMTRPKRARIMRPQAAMRELNETSQEDAVYTMMSDDI